jgi:hypothetical protein
LEKTEKKGKMVRGPKHSRSSLQIEAPPIYKKTCMRDMRFLLFSNKQQRRGKEREKGRKRERERERERARLPACKVDAASNKVQ